MNNYIKAYLTGLVLFIYGLNVPVLSFYLLFAAVAALALLNAFAERYDRKFVNRFMLLGLFAVTYYLFMSIHGFIRINESIRNVIEITGAYALGFSITPGKNEDCARTLPLVLLLMAAGILLFSFLSVYSFIQTSGLIEIAERNAPNFWGGSEVNAPGFGANASLGMCLLPVVFFGRSDDCKGLFYQLIALSILLMFAAGVFINVALQNRTPFLAAAASMIFGAQVYLHSHRIKPSKAIKGLAIAGLVGGGVVYYLSTVIDTTQYNILTRFTEERLETSRYEAWKTMLASLHHSILGGRVVRLGEDMSFVHNLWLDVIWDAGIAPFVFLSAFHFKHLQCFKSILHSKLPLIVVLMIVGLAISFITNFMQEPTLSASVPYFAASCFFLGLVLRVSHDLEYSNIRHDAAD